MVRVAEASGIPLVRDLLKAHEYLRLKGLAFDLVMLNEHGSSYLQDLQHSLLQIVESGPEHAWVDRPGGVFLLRSDLMPPEDQTLIEAAARVVMDGADGRLREQLKRPQVPFGPEPAALNARATSAGDRTSSDQRPAPDARVELFNGSGGFGDDGREYVIDVNLDAGRLPPAPWSNVVAHPSFGFVATECGPGYTWSRNSHDNRLTPWRNDPVSDSPGEAMFIRDEQTGRFWSATPLPAGAGVSSAICSAFRKTPKLVFAASRRPESRMPPVPSEAVSMEKRYCELTAGKLMPSKV